MFALVFHFLSPFSHLSFPSPQSLYPPLQITFGKWLPGRRGDTELNQPQLLLFFFSNYGAHWGGITPRRRDENQCGERLGGFVILGIILSLLKFVSLPFFILSLARLAFISKCKNSGQKESVIFSASLNRYFHRTFSFCFLLPPFFFRCQV